MVALAVADAESVGPYRLTPVSLAPAADPSEADWVAAGRHLRRCGRALWHVGDWMLLGERSHNQTYRTACELTGLDYGTVANAKSVARSFEVSRRREALTFKHHAEVQSLPHQRADALLSAAEQQALSTRALRALVRSGRPPRPRPEVELDPRTRRVLLDRLERATRDGRIDLMPGTADSLELCLGELAVLYEILLPEDFSARQGPDFPSATAPGSAGRVAAYAARLGRKQSLFHPTDARPDMRKALKVKTRQNGSDIPLVLGWAGEDDTD